MSIIPRSALTVAEATSNIESLNEGNAVILGLTDNKFKTREGKTILSYQLVVAELDGSNSIVRLVRVPFPTVRNNRGILDVITKSPKKNSGPMVDFIEKTIAQNANLKIEIIFDEKIIPILQKQVVSVKPHWFRARSARGNECDRVVYQFDKVGTAFDMNAHMTDIEALLKVGNFCLYANNTVYNKDAQITDDAEEAPSGSSSETSAPSDPTENAGF